MKVIINGEVMEKSTDLGYQTLLENNDEIIGSKAAPEIRAGDVKKPTVDVKHPFTPRQNYKFRTRIAKEFLCRGMVPDIDEAKNPFMAIPCSGDIHPGPDPSLAYELAMKYLSVENPVGVEEHAEICAPICKYLAIYFKGKWWNTRESSAADGSRMVSQKATNNYKIYDDMSELIRTFLEDLRLQPGFNTREMARIIQTIEIGPTCKRIMDSMQSESKTIIRTETI